MFRRSAPRAEGKARGHAAALIHRHMTEHLPQRK